MQVAVSLSVGSMGNYINVRRELFAVVLVKS